MAQLQVGNIVLHFSTLRTGEYRFEPVCDPSGQHFECSKIVLEVSGIVNAVTIATNKPIPGEVDIENAGDGLPFTMHNLRSYLEQPRRYIKFSVAGVTVLELPRPQVQRNLNAGVDAIAAAADDYYASDCRGGPYPAMVRLVNITGDKSAMLFYRVEAYDSKQSQYVLSNAWSMSSDIDHLGVTTRRISGRAAFRKDFMDKKGYYPDDFRNLVVPPCTERMRRVGVHVDAPASGHELYYNVVDREVMVGVGGPNSDVLEVTGTVTSGVTYPMTNLKDIVKEVGEVIRDIFNNPNNVAGRLYNSAVPTHRAFGSARAIGRPQCDRNNLVRMATAFLLDRFNPILAPDKAIGAVMSSFVTHNIDTDHNPFAEVKLEVLGISNKILQATFGVEPQKLLNTSNEYKVNGRVIANKDLTAPKLVNSNNTRGDVIGRIFAQSLKAAGGSDVNLPTDVTTNAFKTNLETVLNVARLE